MELIEREVRQACSYPELDPALDMLQRSLAAKKTMRYISLVMHQLQSDESGQTTRPLCTSPGRSKQLQSQQQPQQKAGSPENLAQGLQQPQCQHITAS